MAIRKIAMAIPHLKDPERFFKFIKIVDDNCWNWIGFIYDGYGKFNMKTEIGCWRQYMAHRVSYSIFKGITDRSLLIDHICRNRRCVNPDHLREVNTKTNVIENSISFIVENNKKTHCPYDHEYAYPNLRITKAGGRYCLLCKKIKKRSYDQRSRSK